MMKVKSFLPIINFASWQAGKSHKGGQAAGSGCQRSGGERLRCSCDRCRLWSGISHLFHIYDFSCSSFHCQSLWQCRTVKSGLFQTSSSGFLCVQGTVKGKKGTSVKRRQGRTRFDCQKCKKKSRT